MDLTRLEILNAGDRELKSHSWEVIGRLLQPKYVCDTVMLLEGIDLDSANYAQIFSFLFELEDIMILPHGLNTTKTFEFMII